MFHAVVPDVSLRLPAAVALWYHKPDEPFLCKVLGQGVLLVIGTDGVGDSMLGWDWVSQPCLMGVRAERGFTPLSHSSDTTNAAPIFHPASLPTFVPFQSRPAFPSIELLAISLPNRSSVLKVALKAVPSVCTRALLWVPSYRKMLEPSTFKPGNSDKIFSR